MKTFSAAIFLLIVVALSNCKKSNDAVTLTNCDNLVTDTSGTNDTAAIYIQNAFTPNGDGLNDVSRLVTRGIASITYTVYDGNNAVVFSTNQLGTADAHYLSATESWAPAGSTSTYETYHYRIQATTNSNHHIGACGELYRLTCRPANIALSSLHFEDQLLLNGTYTSASMETLPVCP